MSSDLALQAWPVVRERPQTPREIGRARRVKAMGSVLDLEFSSLMETVYACEALARRLSLTWGA